MRPGEEIETSIYQVYGVQQQKERPRGKKKIYKIFREKCVSAKKHKTVQQKQLTYPDKNLFNALLFPYYALLQLDPSIMF